MLKRTISLIGLLIAFGLIAGTLAAPGHAAAAAGCKAQGKKDTPAAEQSQSAERKRKQRCGQAQQLREQLQKFRKHCGKTLTQNGNANGKREKCRAAARKLIAALEQANKRLEQREAQLRARCESASSEQTRCEQVLERIDKLQTRIAAAIERLQKYLVAEGGSEGGSGESESTVEEDVESVDEVAAELAAIGQ